MISRRAFATRLAGGLAATGLAAGATKLLLTSNVHSALAQEVFSVKPFAPVKPWAAKLISAAESQVGRTVNYDGAYVKLAYPMGDIPAETGVCTDVIVRAYREAFGIDLQRLVHEDMKRSFGSYPKIWGLKRPDKNIDHRRVPNLERYFARRRASLPISRFGKDYLPGDLVSQRLPGNLPHIAIVSQRPSRDGERPLIIHNIGAGTQIEDRLLDFKITGHFRFSPTDV